MVSPAAAGGSPEPALSRCPAVGRPSRAGHTLSFPAIPDTQRRRLRAQMGPSASSPHPPLQGLPALFHPEPQQAGPWCPLTTPITHALFLGTPCWIRGWGKAPTMNQCSVSERSSLLRGWAGQGSNKDLLTKNKKGGGIDTNKAL